MSICMYFSIQNKQQNQMSKRKREEGVEENKLVPAAKHQKLLPPTTTTDLLLQCLEYVSDVIKIILAYTSELRVTPSPRRRVDKRDTVLIQKYLSSRVTWQLNPALNIAVIHNSWYQQVMVFELTTGHMLHTFQSPANDHDEHHWWDPTLHHNTLFFTRLPNEKDEHWTMRLLNLENGSIKSINNLVDAKTWPLMGQFAPLQDDAIYLTVMKREASSHHKDVVMWEKNKQPPSQQLIEPQQRLHGLSQDGLVDLVDRSNQKISVLDLNNNNRCYTAMTHVAERNFRRLLRHGSQLLMRYVSWDDYFEPVSIFDWDTGVMQCTVSMPVHCHLVAVHSNKNNDSIMYVLDASKQQILLCE